MTSHYRKLGELLVNNGVITNLQLSIALAAQQTSNRRLGEILVERGFSSEEQIADCLAQQYGYPLADLDFANPESAALAILGPEMALSQGVLPLSVRGDEFHCVIADPIDVVTTDYITQCVRKRLCLQVAPRSKLTAAIKSAYGLHEEQVGESFEEASALPPRFYNARPRRRFGVVALLDAYDRELDRRVTLSAVPANTEHEREQFLLVKAAARATSPSVSAIHDWFEHGGLRWTVFEHLEGETLEHVLRTRGARSVSQAAELVAQLAAGADSLNSNGERCGLVCPANVLIRSAGALLAPLVWPPAEYASPEGQGAGANSPAADVYALGTLLWECVSGENPHSPAEGADGECAWALPMHDENGLPSALVDVLAECLATEPHKRFASPIQLADALRSYNWSAVTYAAAGPVPDSGQDRDELLEAIAAPSPAQEKLSFWRRWFGRRKDMAA